MIKGAIFDVDGVILDSMKVCNRIGEQIVLRRGITPESDLNEKLFSMTVPQALKYLIDKYKLGCDFEQLMKETDDFLYEYYSEKVLPKDGALELLEDLHSRNIPMIVASSTADYLIESAFERLGIRKYFVDILSCQTLNTNKSERYIFDLALSKINVAAEDTYLFEDGLYSIKTAHGLGLCTVGVYDDESAGDFDEVKKVTDICYSSLNEYNFSDFMK